MSSSITPDYDDDHAILNDDFMNDGQSLYLLCLPFD